MIFAGSCNNHKKNEPERQLQTVDVAYPLQDSVVLRKTYPGYLLANNEVDLVARVDGYLVSQNYKSGDFVRKGTVLFKLEDSNYRDAVNRASAALEAARANCDYASSRYAAMTEALKSDAVSEMEVAQAKSNLEQCQAEIKTAEAELRTAQTALSYCTIVAPFDGHVSKTPYSVGAYFSGAGAPVKLASIYDDALVALQFTIEDAVYLSAIRHAMADGKADFSKVPVKFAEPLQHEYTADISYLSPSVDTSTGTMIFQADIQNPYGELKSGMFGSIELPYAVDNNAILINDASISDDQLGKYVYTVNDSNKVVYTPIEVGDLYNDTLRIVTKGLTPGDRYVTKALLKVRDGMEVNPKLIK